MRNGILFLMCFAFSCISVDSYKLLCLSPMSSHSHFHIVATICKELARKGHEVTVVSPFPNKVQMKNWKDLSIAELRRVMDDGREHYLDMNRKNIVTTLHLIYDMCNNLTETVLKHENIQTLLKSNETFDGVILEYTLNEALMGFASYYKVPLILISSMPTSTWTNHLVANPGPSSYVPNLLSLFSDEMTFTQRIINTFYDTTEVIMKELIAIPEQERLLKKYIPNAPRISEIRYNTSIFLINSHESISNARPHMPSMIQIGGYHVKPTKQLPQDIKEFLDDAEDGVILFSMGSNFRDAHLPTEARNQILKTLNETRRNVLWKFEESVPELPSNVKIHKWLPQQDILAHPNVLCFVTHGGHLSMTEAVYFGVPVVGIPVFGDQMMNMARAANNGYAVQIQLSELTAEKLSRAIDEVSNNPRYRNEARRRSQIMRDREVKPLDTAVYWIEYAIRHNGATHLRSAALKLAWYQRNLLDVWIFLGSVLIALIFFIASLVRICYSSHIKISVSWNKKNM